MNNIDKTPSEEPVAEKVTADQEPKQKPTRKFLSKLKLPKFQKKQLRLIPVALLAIALILSWAIRPLRTNLYGKWLKSDITLKVVDQTGAHVTSYKITLDEREYPCLFSEADKTCLIKDAPSQTLTLGITKQNYQAISSVITPGNHPEVYRLTMNAKGDTYLIKTVNFITKETVQSSVSKDDVKLDKKGETESKLLLEYGASLDGISLSVKADGYSNKDIVLKKSDANDKKEIIIELSPTGRLAFLSKASGKIDVVSTNLDGSDRKTLVAGTGNEEDSATTLLASTDWKYLVLNSKRVSGKPSVIYSVDPVDGNLEEIDSGDVFFRLIGWYGHKFVYSVERNNVEYFSPKKYSIKYYDAEDKTINTIFDNSIAETNIGSGIDYKIKVNEFVTSNNPYITDSGLLITKSWEIENNYYLGDNEKKAALGDRKLGVYLIPIEKSATIKPLIEESPLDYWGIQLSYYKPNEFYATFGSNQPNSSKTFEIEDGSAKKIDNFDSTNIYKTYPTYLVAPSGKDFFWSESRDGKNSLFTGSTESPKNIKNLSELNAYGWYSDKYLITSKNSSELWIMAVDGKSEPVKISDYHKPNYTFPGYGYGYGGL